MCGVAGYIGTQSGKETVVDTLARLHYRGNGGVGFACLTEDQAVSTINITGSVDQFKRAVSTYGNAGPIAIGQICRLSHTNASHSFSPYTNTAGSIACVSHGRLHNAQELTQKLNKYGFEYRGTADLALLPHLLEYYLQISSTFEQALSAMTQVVQGVFAMVGFVTEHPNVLISIRKTAPLSVIVDTDHIRIASDFRALAHKEHNKGFFHPDHSFGMLSAQDMRICTSDGKVLPIAVKEIITPQQLSIASSYDKVFNTVREHLVDFVQVRMPDKPLPIADDELIRWFRSLLHHETLADEDQKYITRMVQTLDNITHGLYGVCIGCGYPISDQVLAMYPHMVVCRQCDAYGDVRA